MSYEILEAIDKEVDTLAAELDELTEKLDRGRRRIDALSMTRRLVDGIGNGRLDELHDGLKGLGLGLDKRPPKPKPKPTKPKKPAAASDAPAEAPRQRTDVAEAAKRKVRDLLRRKAEITAQDLVDAGIVFNPGAARSLIRGMLQGAEKELIVAGERKGAGRPAKTYKLAADLVTADEDGAKTDPERRVVASIREAGGELDEGTLAFNAAMSLNDLKTYASGLLRRRVLSRRDEEGVTLWAIVGTE